MSKTAIFGGTFNPPHLAHKDILMHILDLDIFDEILVMPANVPPHKDVVSVSVEDRLNMCRLCFGGFSGVRISDEELKLRGKSYTLNTLEKLKEKGILNPTLVIGADSLVTFNKWYEYKKILSLCNLMVYLRDGVEKDKILKAKAKLEKEGGVITVLDYTPPAISSSEVRQAFKEKGSADGLLSAEVEKYINEHKLYF